jgi:hypothetical protein
VVAIGGLRAGKSGKELYGMANTAGGIKNLGIKSEAFKIQVKLLVSGIAGLICAPLMFAGLFKIKKNAQGEQKDREQDKNQDRRTDAATANTKDAGDKELGLLESLNPKNLKEIAAYAWKHDKRGLLGRGLQLLLEMGFLTISRATLKENPQDIGAYNTAAFRL